MMPEEEVTAFAAQYNAVNMTNPAALLRQVRVAVAAGATENSLMPHVGMTLAQICTMLILHRSAQTSEKL